MLNLAFSYYFNKKDKRFLFRTGLTWLEKAFLQLDQFEVLQQRFINAVLNEIQILLNEKSESADEFVGKLEVCYLSHQYCIERAEYASASEILKILSKYLKKLDDSEVARFIAGIDRPLLGSFFHFQYANSCSDSVKKERHRALGKYFYNLKADAEDLCLLGHAHEVNSSNIKKLIEQDHVVALYQQASLLETNKPKKAFGFYLKLLMLTAREDLLSESKQYDPKLNIEIIKKLHTKAEHFFKQLASKKDGINKEANYILDLNASIAVTNIPMLSFLNHEFKKLCIEKQRAVSTLGFFSGRPMTSEALETPLCSPPAYGAIN